MKSKMGQFLAKNLNDSTNWLQAGSQLFSEIFAIDNNSLEKILSVALDKGGDYADIYFEYSLYNGIVLDESIVKSASQSISLGAGIRVISGDQTGYSYSESMELDSLLKAAKNASAIANAKQIKSFKKLQRTTIKQSHYRVIETFQNLAAQNRIELLHMADKTARNEDPRVIQVTANINDVTSFVMFANSQGRLISDTRPMLKVGVNIVLKDGDKTETVQSGGGGRMGLEYLEKHPLEKHSAEAIRQGQVLLEAKNAPAGQFPVILKAAQSGILLHEAIGHPLEADFNRKNTSAYSGRIGETVASPLCTIVDDGTISNDRGSINFDDEGVKTKRNVLIDKGRLQSYMHDRISATHYNVEPTGNGRRESYQFYPLPRMTTTYMENGESDPEEIISSVDKGVYCCTFKGGQVDISNGDFVFVPVEAYWIENGKIKHPVKNFTLIGNGPDVLTKVSMVGNDFEFSDGMWTCGKGQNVPVGIGLPTVKIDDMTVGGQ